MTVANPWPQAAQRLAQRVNARARQNAVLERVGPALLVAGVAAVAARLLGAPRTTVIVMLVVGLVGGAILGLRRRFAVRRVSTANAAWALDRVGGRGEHGLAAAVGTEPVAEKAAAQAAQPPSIRMLPPHGLAWAAAGLLAAGVAWMAPGPSQGAGSDQAAQPEATAGAGGAGGTQAGGGGTGEGLAQVARVREALNLPPDGALNREAVVKQFADPAARNRALKAAGTGPVADRLQQGDNSAEALAEALLDADQAVRAAAVSERRREAEAQARASLHAGASARVPAHRRGVVKRYLERLAN